MFDALFARIPDDVILAMSQREFDMWNADICICGWALREGIAKQRHVNAVDVSVCNVHFDHEKYLNTLVELYGGEREDWNKVFMDAPYTGDIVRAFENRVSEATLAATVIPSWRPSGVPDELREYFEQLHPGNAFAL